MVIERWAVVLPALAEPLLALAVATLLTAGLVLPFMPRTLTVPLEPLEEAGAVRSAERLAGEIETLGLAERVEVVPDQGRPHLVLIEPIDEESAASGVLKALESAGYRRVELQAKPSPDRLGPGVLMIMMSIQAGIFLIGGGVLARWRVTGRWPGSAVHPVRAGLIGLGGGVAALLLSGLLSMGLQALGLPVEEQAWLQELFSRPEDLLRVAPWIVLVGPVAEEVFFRGYAFRFIDQQLGFAAGLLVSSVMFAAIHRNLSGFLIYLLIGCVLAYVHRRTGTLVAPIIGHATVNGVVLIGASLAA